VRISVNTSRPSEHEGQVQDREQAEHRELDPRRPVVAPAQQHQDQRGVDQHGRGHADPIRMGHVL
jgi:hypothetical protein